MKLLFGVLALIAASQAISLQRASFLENTEDFIELIIEEIGDQLMDLFEQYLQDEEMDATMNFLESQDFAALIAEMESLPEFNAFIDFIEEDGIQIHYFIALMHEAFGWDEYIWKRSVPSVHQKLGRSYNNFLRAFVDLLPREKLEALHQEKMETDEEFRVTFENLFSQEFNDLWNALRSNPVFAAELQTLDDNGIDVDLLIAAIQAVYGIPRPSVAYISAII